MRIAITGGAGFIGTNLAIKLSQDVNNQITVIDEKTEYFQTLKHLNLHNVRFVKAPYSLISDFDSLLTNQDVIYHLASTNIPGTSNLHIPEELESNVIVTAKLLDACVRQGVKKVVFVSSGGTVYGKKGTYPIAEDMVTYPISSYGVQKLAIEKLLYLYRYQFGLDYRIIRLANPYGPYQRPNGRLGVVTTFVYKAINHEKLEVYGDGSVVRDFIYIGDAIRGLINISAGDNDFRVFNLGSGKGTSISQVIDTIRKVINPDLQVEYIESRSTDVPVNFLDIRRYESIYGQLSPISLEEGILQTADFLKNS